MFNTIESAPNAPEGKVSTLSTYTAADFKPGSAILARNAAPLVAFAYGLLLRDVPCRIVGRDIGKQLIKLVEKMRAQNLEEFLERLTQWETREVDRAILDDRNPERITDQADCLRFFVRSLDEDSRSIDSLKAKIDLMFTDEQASASRVILSTIHKAKGGEWEDVFFLDRHLIPSRYCKREWQRVQERNLLYVAVTRAQSTLTYITSDRWKEVE